MPWRAQKSSMRAIAVGELVGESEISFCPKISEQACTGAWLPSGDSAQSLCHASGRLQVQSCHGTHLTEIIHAWHSHFGA